MTLAELEKIAIRESNKNIAHVREAIESSLKVVEESGNFDNMKVALLIGELQMTMANRVDALQMCACYAVCLQMLHEARNATSKSLCE